MITVQSFLSFRYARMASCESLLVFRSWYPDSCINLGPMKWAWHLGRDPPVLKIPHTHHHSYAIEGMQMRGHHEGVHHEGVGVAYRACGCGLQSMWVWLTEHVGVAYSWGCIAMFDDSLDTPLATAPGTCCLGYLHWKTVQTLFMWNRPHPHPYSQIYACVL